MGIDSEIFLNMQSVLLQKSLQQIKPIQAKNEDMHNKLFSMFTVRSQKWPENTKPMNFPFDPHCQ